MGDKHDEMKVCRWIDNLGSRPGRGSQTSSHCLPNMVMNAARREATEVE